VTPFHYILSRVFVTPLHIFLQPVIEPATIMAFSSTDVVSNLPAQIVEVLRDQRMSFTQLSTYYSIKYRSSLTGRLKGAKAANLKEYLEGLENIFEVQDEFVKVRPKGAAQPGTSDKPAITSIRYAHISKGLQNLLNETHSKSMAIADLEATFQAKFGVSLGSVIGMPTVEYLQRKANVFEIEGDVVLLQNDFQKETELKIDMDKGKDLSPIAEDPEKPSKARQAWADLPVIPEPDLCPKPQKDPTPALDDILSSLRNVASGIASKDAAPANPANLAGVQAKAENDLRKQEAAAKDKKCENLPLFAVDELVRIFEEHSEGPIMHSSVLCSMFMQQLGASVTEISGKKPMELFRQHPEAFIWLSSGNVALAKFRNDKAVQHELKLLDDQPKCVRVKAAAAEASLPVPEKVSEEDVVNYMIGLLQENEDRDSIYISALCGRFMQRFRKPVTEIVGCKPTDFLKKYKDVFYLEKGGHVKLVKGTDQPAFVMENSQAKAVASSESPVVSGKNSPQQNATSQEKAPLSSASAQPDRSVVPEAAPAPQTIVVTVPPPWRRTAPEADKEIRQATPQESVDAEIQQHVGDFCTRLRKQLFFRVSEVLSGSPSPAPLLTQGEIPVTVKVANLPKEIETQWLPQLLNGLEQVLKLKFPDEVDRVSLEGEGVHCRLRNFSVGLFVHLQVV